ncbi:MAG: 30S ribosomal protein S6 [Sandaracinaceae bacterium]|nr:30S ribosomal protein S6 [Sandaracinaceae bacterium]MBK8587814.1 30S ribosomal protein S6 [Sandaracinaceae bacterium]
MTSAAAAPTRWAREYETIYILRPNVDSAEAEKVATRVREVMGRLNATLTKVDTWGKRRMAYPIQKHTRGIYVYLRYVGFGDIVAELERNLRLLDAVMRFQTIVLADKIDPASVTVDAAEVEFETIQQSEDEPELTFAQRLGLEERARRDDREMDVPEDDADEPEDATSTDDNEDEEA